MNPLRTITGFLFAGALLVTGCQMQPRYAVSAEDFARAEIPGIPGARIFADMADPELMQRFEGLLEGMNRNGGPDKIVTVLSLSGGGENGAYGAGVLAGWTESGERPEFDVVTGISTGSLIAPIAFLGASHDEALHKYYKITKDNVLIKLGIFGILKQRTAISKSQPLVDLIATVVGEEEIEAIAEEHRKGRRLLVATTNLDTQQGVVWDIGHIAASGHPNALSVIRSVLLASSSIPVAFPPVLIDVELDGVPHDEMHVDGGVIAQAFGFGVLIAGEELLDQDSDKHYYLIRNGRFEPSFESTEMRMTAIGGRSLSTVIKTMGQRDLLEAYTYSTASGAEFHYTSIPEDFDVERKEAFDTDYMKALFDAGHEFGKSGEPWHSIPPLLRKLPDLIID